MKRLGFPLPLLLGLLLSSCGTRLVDACDDPRTRETTCINLQIEGTIGQLDQLNVLVSGDWVGHTESTAMFPFDLPAAIAVALPPYFQGGVRLDIRGFAQGREVGSASTQALGLSSREHRQVNVQLVPAK